MHQPNLYRSVDRDRSGIGIGTAKMIPRSSSVQHDKVFRSVDREGVDGGSVTALPRSNPLQQEKRITRSNLVDQLREYQIRSKHDWASVSFFSSTSNLSSSRKIATSACVMVILVVVVKTKLCFLTWAILIRATVILVDVVVFVIWELVILASLVFSAVSLYFQHLRLGFVLATITLLLLLSMKVTKRIKLAQKKKRRMLLPLSM